MSGCIPTLGYQELKAQGYSDLVLNSVLYHHENFDGTGYPSNLTGDEIPLGARILRVCAMFMRSDPRARTGRRWRSADSDADS